MAKTVKVVFEIDAEEVKRMIAAGKGKTTELTPAAVDKMGKDDVIRASDLLTKPIANGVATIFTKMQLVPDQSPTLITTVAKQFLFPKAMARMLVQQHTMFCAGMKAEEQVAARRRG